MPDPHPTNEFVPVSFQLRNGRRVTVREIRPEDKDAIHDAIGHLSADSRYTRFMAAVSDVPDRMLEKATHPAPDREFALVAVSEDEGREVIVAGTRYASTAGSESCEFAITIVDDWQGQGLASKLLQMLIDAARAHGFKTMEGYVLSRNAPMRALAKRLGFHEGPCPGDATVRIVTRPLDGDASPPA